jgi:hypothetical protein
MNNTFFIAAIVFLYIAYGATWKWTHPKDFGLPPIAMILNNVICIIGYILPAICICKLTNITWYWSALINFIAIISISHIISSIYIIILGCKTDGIDALITVCLGVLFFIIAISI